MKATLKEVLEALLGFILLAALAGVACYTAYSIGV
jgi:hypothetical protein